jgi:REP element-mobilizing transposase RayT
MFSWVVEETLVWSYTLLRSGILGKIYLDLTMPTGYQINDQFQPYYLTLQVVEWVDVFSRKVYRYIILENLKFCREHKSLELYAYVIMSNHIHLIARSSIGDLSGVIRHFKSFTSKQILNTISEVPESRKDWMLKVFSIAAAKHKRNSDYQFWTHENHAIELVSNKFIKQKLNYIHQNPVRAGLVEQPEDYLYSSARNYAEMDYLMEIDFL